MADDQTNNQTDGQTNGQTTEESFTNIDPNELPDELQKTYKLMQADYTRKTQELADMRKSFSEKENDWQDKLKSFGQVEHELKQWHDWYSSLAEEAGQDDQQGQQQQQQQQQTNSQQREMPNYLDEPGSEDIKKHIESLQQAHQNELGSLKQEVESLQAALKDTTDQTSRMFNYHAQLNELAQKYTGLDKQELLEHALKTGQTDLDKAYQDLHQDEFINQMAEERVKELMAKERTKGIKSTGQQILMRPNKDAPKSFTEATEQVLTERASQGQ